MQRSMTRTPLIVLAGLTAVSVVATAQEATRAAVKDPAPSRADQIQIVTAKAAPVPGHVEIDGGRTQIGTSDKEVEALLALYPGFVRVLDAQTPQHTVDVAPFWIATNELTNAEYLVFVEATGHQPPIHWANDEAMQAAALAFAKEQNDKFEAAKAEGRKYEKLAWAAGPSPNPRERWWAANWREAGYAIPEGLERFPVVYVTYEDALGYCDWAGLRLPTEYEFQRAARKDTKNVYPWGDAWEDGKFCNSSELRRAKPFAVGSFAAGASPYGIHDLAGNVWEWTSSPYVAYKGFKPGEYSVAVNGKKEKLKADPNFDPNQRVVVGGAYEVEKLAARVSTRRGTERSQFTGAMGFRTAASSKVGVDKAQLLVENEIRLSASRPDGVTYASEGTVALDRWRVGATGITAYDHFLFLPVAEITETVDSEFDLASRTKPIHLGVYSSNLDLVQPELPAGAYYVAYRAKGKVPRPKADEKADAEGGGEKKGDQEPKDDKDAKAQEPEAPVDPVLEGLDLDKSWLLFLRVSDGTRAVAVEMPEGLKWGKGNGGGHFAVRMDKVRVGSGANATIEDQWFLDLKCGLVGKLRGRSLDLTLALRPGPSAVGAPWRQ